jgi:transcriptional regulator with XRE-family HTH domain
MPVRLGNFIRERRQELGLTQEQLAERIGDTVRQAEVSRLENDRISLPRRDRLRAIANALEVSVGELLIRTGWMDEEADLDALEAAAGLGASDAVVEPPDPNAAAELVSVKAALAAALEMLDRTSDALEQTQEALDSLQQLVEESRQPRGEVHTRIGVMDDWESMVVFSGP